jgi:peptide deformylase
MNVYSNLPKCFFLILLLALAMLSCSKSSFSKADKVLINAGTSEMLFRVLQITDLQDSIVLRTPCTDIADFANDSDFHLLIARLKTTLAVEDGVGIAAPQVGISKNIFLFMRLDMPDEPVFVAVNPKIVAYADSTVCFERDGCLSIPDFRGNSVRYTWIDVEYYNERGELIRERLTDHSRQNTFTAVIFQHEYDHTKGVLFIDKLCE